MITWIHALVLGVVEGVTEFLPISSTAHLIITGQLLRLPNTEFLKSFDIIIQSGAILAVVCAYWRSFLRLDVLKRIAAGFLPTGIIGFLLYKAVKQYLIGNVGVVAWALLIGGIVLVLVETFVARRAGSAQEDGQADAAAMSYAQCLAVGTIQALAVIPGVSRSAATIAGGLAMGVKRRVIVEYSFLLAVPTMLAATSLDIIKNGPALSQGPISFLIVGFIVSFATALLAIRWLLQYVKGHGFIPFAVYRVILALVLLLAA